LIANAIEGGIYHDLGSGSNVDLCIIEKDRVEFLKNYVSKNKKAFSMERSYNFPKGTTSNSLFTSNRSIKGICSETS